MNVPTVPKIYHILHVDRLPSILADGHLWSDAEVNRRRFAGTTIGMSSIKRRRLEELTLSSHPGLYVGACVPFYFCPRSVMLYLIDRANHPDLQYRGGQGPILHLELDLQRTVAWAEEQGLRWAFTLSNAGSRYFEDRADLACLRELDWQAIATHNWQGCQEKKQAEFLVEQRVPWSLVERIGVLSQATAQAVAEAARKADHKPQLRILREWYY